MRGLLKEWGAAARRGLAEIRQGTMTRRSTATARKRDAVWSRNPPSPYGLGRGSPHSFNRPLKGGDRDE